MALDVDTARKAGYGVGDTVTLVTPGDPPTLKAKVSGLVEFGSGGLNGATLTLFDVRVLQKQFFGGRDVYTSISLDAAPGVSQVQLRDAAQEVLPKDVVARTGDALVKKNKAPLDEILGFLNTFLLVFAAVSLVVGTFLIVNTFSILVAQRSRELALLRALGASRRQVNLSVLVEALVVGLFGSTLGLGAGYLLARGLQLLFGAVGFDLSRASSRSTCAPSSRRTPSGSWSRSWRRTSRPGAPRRSRPSRRCATTSRCRSRRCTAGCSSGSGSSWSAPPGWSAASRRRATSGSA